MGPCKASIGRNFHIPSLTPVGGEDDSTQLDSHIRHAFITYKNWRIGQTRSTFEDTGALPEPLDFIGFTDATIFDRQFMLRYSNGGFQIAVAPPRSQ